MLIHVLGGFGGESIECRMTCVLINETLALDAGSLTQTLPIDRQRAIRAILLSHSHIDHTASLPFFVENVYGALDDGVDVYASKETIYAIRKHLFNNDTWPDFTRLPNHLLPALRFHPIEPEVPFEVQGIRVTPVPVNHLVPTFGFLLEENGAAILWSSDTGPTERLWQIANATPNLKAVCIETTFPNELQAIADVSHHLTPATLERELEKLERDVPIYLHHLKPPSIREIRQQVQGLDRSGIHFLEQGRRYDFS